MFRKTAVILVSGRISSGKTTSSNILNDIFKREGYNSTVANFALGVKRIATLMGWNKEKDKKGRKLLIDIGMAGRAYDENTWPKITFDLYLPEADNYPFDAIIVDDWRFPNEGKYVENNPMYRVFKVRIVGRGGDSFSNDLSETSLPDPDNVTQTISMPYDIIINNSKSIDELTGNMEVVFRNVRKEMENDTSRFN